MTKDTEAEYPEWQKIDIFLSKEWDEKDVDWQATHDKGAYMRDEKNRTRAKKALDKE